MLPKRNIFKKRIKFQFKGIRLFSPQTKDDNPKVIEEDERELASELCNHRYCCRAHLSD